MCDRARRPERTCPYRSPAACHGVCRISKQRPCLKGRRTAVGLTISPFIFLQPSISCCNKVHRAATRNGVQSRRAYDIAIHLPFARDPRPASASKPRAVPDRSGRDRLGSVISLVAAVCVVRGRPAAVCERLHTMPIATSGMAHVHSLPRGFRAGRGPVQILATVPCAASLNAGPAIPTTSAVTT